MAITVVIYLSHKKGAKQRFQSLSLSLRNDVQSVGCWKARHGKTFWYIWYVVGIMLGHVVQQQQTVLITSNYIILHLVTSNYSTEVLGCTWRHLGDVDA